MENLDEKQSSILRALVTTRYFFCQRVLPQTALSDPTRFVTILNGHDRNRYLGDLWAQACKATGKSDTAPPAALSGLVRRAGDTGVIAFCYLPSPEESGEAHVAALFSKFVDPTAPSFKDFAWTRFFLLERGVELSTSRETQFLCERTNAGIHLNYGAVEVAGTDHDGFFHATLAVLRKEKHATSLTVP